MAGKYSLKKEGGNTSKGGKAKPKEKAFLGINLPNLPKLPFGGPDLPDLPALGVTTDRHNPVTQVEDLVTGFPAGLTRLAFGLTKENLSPAGLRASAKGFAEHGVQGFKEASPTTHALISSPIRTAKTLNPVDLATHAAKGDFAGTELGKRIKEEGVLGTGLATVSDVSLLAAGAGLLGKAAGAGSLAKAANLERAAAASTKAAGLGRGAGLPEVIKAADEALQAGRAGEAAELGKIAGQLDEAAKLRATKTTLPAKLTEKAQDVSRLGAELGNAPAKPYQMLGKGLAKVPAGIGAGVEAAVEKGLPGSKIAEKAVGAVSNVVKYAGDKAKIADLYYRNVTAPTQEALFRRLERGESVEAIRADLTQRFPGSEPVFQKFVDDLQGRVDKVNATRPTGTAEKLTGAAREIWSKSPEQWQTDLDAATVKLENARAARAALPDGDAGFKSADKAVKTAKSEVDRINAMRKMSMLQPSEELAARVSKAEPEAAVTKTAPVEDAVPAADTPGGPSFEEMNTFNKENIKAVRAEFHGQIQESFAPGLTAETVVPQTQLPKGHGVDLGEALKSRGYTAWDPVTGAELKSAQIRPDSPVLPNQVFDEVSRYSKYNAFDKANSKLLQAYDYATGKWKHTVLALSPRWHVGNVLGNIAMAGAAGVSPLEVLQLGPKAWGMVKSGESPAELLASGFHFSEEAMNSITQGPLKGAKEMARHPIQASYQMNQFVDDVNRTLVYLSKKNQGLSERAAIQSALKAAGDFSRMTPFERNVARRVMPFYAWQKHITKLTFRLPLEDPARVAWTLHLADMGERTNPDPGANSEFTRNTMPLPGGKRLSLNPLNPFASSSLLGYTTGVFGDADQGSQGSAGDLTRSLNPVAGGLLAAFTGISPKRGFAGVTTPDQEFGEGPQPLISSPSNLLNYVSQQVPFTRQLQDAAAGKTKTRFDTGQERPAQYPADAQGRLEQLVNFLGLNVRPDLKGAESEKVTKEKPGRKSSTTGKYKLKK